MNHIRITYVLPLQMRCKSKDNKDSKVSKDSKDDKEGGLDFQNSRLLDSIENPTKKHKNAHALAYIKKK